MAMPVTVRYRNIFENVYKSALIAISACGYSIGATNKDTGVISFETGVSIYSWAGQKMYILVMELQEGLISVTVGGIRKSHCILWQIYDWGESAKIGSKIHDQIDVAIQSLEKTTSIK